MSGSSRSTEIQQQLAHLRWRRLQNERAVRNVLESTKSMKQNDTMLQISVNHTNEKKSWMSSVIEDELARPLILTDTDLDKLRCNELLSEEKFIKKSEENKAKIFKVKKLIHTDKNKEKSKPSQGNHLHYSINHNNI
mmetsp:Transcript_236/g.221  ORF Transcript_236/g.221 Transcript_236/m.221 type:complete len:137 (-) Transcript_236:38-448(-)